jgi:hypothetical protein
VRFQHDNDERAFLASARALLEGTNGSGPPATAPAPPPAPAPAHATGAPRGDPQGSGGQRRGTGERERGGGAQAKPPGERAEGSRPMAPDGKGAGEAPAGPVKPKQPQPKQQREPVERDDKESKGERKAAEGPRDKEGSGRRRRDRERDRKEYQAKGGSAKAGGDAGPVDGPMTAVGPPPPPIGAPVVPSERTPAVQDDKENSLEGRASRGERGTTKGGQADREPRRRGRDKGEQPGLSLQQRRESPQLQERPLDDPPKPQMPPGPQVTVSPTMLAPIVVPNVPKETYTHTLVLVSLRHCFRRSRRRAKTLCLWNESSPRSLPCRAAPLRWSLWARRRA